MKALRIAALGVALVVSSATMAQAQGGGGGGGGGGGRNGGRGNMLMVGIDSTLTEAQKSKMAEITAKYQPEQAEIRTLMATDREGAMKKNAELTTKRNADIRAILTPAQQAIFDKNVEEAAKRAAARAGGSPE